jgi:uncharacterized protein (TIGR03067 family)
MMSAYLLLTLAVGVGNPDLSGSNSPLVGAPEGTWELVAVENFVAPSDGDGNRYVFAGGKFEIKEGESITRGTYLLTPTSDTAGHIDFSTEHVGAKGEMIYERALYRLQGERLQICIAPYRATAKIGHAVYTQADRPTEFTVVNEAGTPNGNTLLTLKRVRP